MPLDDVTKAKIDAAVEVAMVEFREYAKEHPEECAWFAKFHEQHTSATYKYLCKAIIAFGKSGGK